MAGRVGHRSWHEVAVAAGLFVLALWLVWHARTFGPQARILPLAAGIPLLALTAFNLLSLSTRGREAASPARTPVPGTPGPQASPTPGPQASPTAPDGAAVVTTERGLPPVLVLLALAVLVALFTLFGMVIAALTYPVAVMRVYGKHSWARSIIAACAICAVLYGASRALGITVFEGWLFVKGILPELPL